MLGGGLAPITPAAAWAGQTFILLGDSWSPPMLLSTISA